ncbi:MAG: carboxymuconolactone decarboxylase family protein [Prolixibacteraceae bacterium]
MKIDIDLPEIIRSRNGYKKKYDLAEMYMAFVFVPAAMIILMRNNKRKTLDPKFLERIQLAVTEVNGCAICSYAHTYLALKQGISKEEIDSFLLGNDQFVQHEEAKALLFAQHFADTGGFPKKDAFDILVGEYGEEKAGIIFSAAQVMMAANIYGIPYSALQSRFKGKPYTNSTLFYELGMEIAGLICIPIALVHGLLNRLFGASTLKLDTSAD